MTNSQKFRFACIVLLWVLLVVYILMYSVEITLYTIFVITTSGIVVFVPLYKKYIKNNDGEKENEQ